MNISLSTATDYFWSAESTWDSNDINVPQVLPEVPNLAMTYFADHTAKATDNSATTPVALTVFPNNIGESAMYRFTITNPSDIDEINANSQIWVWFDDNYFDWYVGDSEAWFEGAYDEDGFLLHYLPCNVRIADATTYVSGADCWTKRH